MDQERLSLHAIPDAFLQDGPSCCVVDWASVGRHLKDRAEVDLEAAYATLARDWLERLAAIFLGEYRVYESPNFLVLSARGQRLASNLMDLGEKTFSTMTSSLPNLAARHGYGKFVCIVADSLDRYYGYLEQLFPDGDFPTSSGMFLGGGYSQFLINHSEPWDQEYTFVHELTHALLQGNAHPHWLEEGLTQLMEEAVLGGSSFVMNREEAERHREYWTEHGLTAFWYGASFLRHDEGMELSYSLAQVIVRNMLSRSRETFLRFAEGASDLDCGEESSRAIYQLSLGDWAAQFLGEGSWDVTVEKAREYVARAHLYLRRDHIELACKDLEAAIAQETRDPDCLNNLAWVLATHPDERVRDGDAAVRLAEQGCKLTGWRDEPLVDTLAAAYAERGDFDEAIRYAERAIELASEEVVPEEQARLELYRAGRPFREDVK